MASKKVDPNVYALSIALDLESSGAVTVLDTFTDKATELEANLASAAQQSLSSITALATTAVSEVEKIGETFTKLRVSTLGVNQDLMKSSKEITDQFDTGEDQLDNLKDVRDITLKMQKTQIKMGKELDEHLKVNEIFLKGTNNIVKAVHAKNEAHRIQNALLQNDIAYVAALNNSLGKTNNNVKKNVDAWTEVKRAIATVWNAIKLIDQDTEKFTTTNYRAYGSQQELVQGARDISMEHGVLYDKAIEAYAVLGDIKVPREELDKYAKSLVQANRYTGVSMQSLGVFAQRMRGAGNDASATERQLKEMSESMRKFGLNTSDVNKIVSDTAVSGAQLRLIFNNKDAVQGIDNIKGSLMGVNKELGQSTDIANNYINVLSKDAIARARLESLTDVQINNTDDLAVAVSKAGGAIRDMGYDIDEALDGTSVQAQKTREHLANVYTGGDVDALLMLLRTSKLTNAYGQQIKSVKDLEAALGKAKDSGIDPLYEIYRALTSQLMLLKSQGFAALGTILQPIADGMMVIVMAINWLIKQLYYLAGGLQTAYDWLKKNIPGFQYAAVAIGWVIKVVLALIIGIALLSASFSALSSIFSIFGTKFGLIGRILTGVGRIIIQTAMIIAQAIKIVLTGIGEGLAALGRAVKPVMVPLLALGATFLLVGIGAYFFALAIEKIAQQGNKALPIVIGMVAVIIVLSLVLIALAHLVKGKVALGLIILAIVFLAIGAAALMTGAGLRLAAEGIKVLAGSLSFKLILQLYILASTIVLLGAVGLLAAPGIIALSFAMVLLAGAVWLLGRGFAGISKHIETLAGTDTKKLLMIGAAFLIAGAAFLAGAVMLLAAAVVLVVAAPAILVATSAMMVAATLILPMALVLLAGGALLLTGSLLMLASALLLHPASEMILESGAMLATGGALLLMGATSLVSGSGFLIAAGGLLAAAGLALYIGVRAMNKVAGSIYNIGALIGEGGTTLLTGSEAIYLAAPMLLSGASTLVDAAAMLMIAGLWLVPASFMMFIGLRWLGYAIYRFSKTIEDVEKVSKAVAILAVAFHMLSVIPLGSLNDMASKTLDAIPNIELLADKLTIVAGKLQTAVDVFRGPANELSEIFDRLSKSAASFSASVKVTEDIEKLAALVSASKANSTNTVRSETISTVKVMNDVEKDNDAAAETAQDKTVILLQSLNDRLAGLRVGKDELEAIVQLLRTYLPNISLGDSGLGNAMNAWAN